MISRKRKVTNLLNKIFSGAQVHRKAMEEFSKSPTRKRSEIVSSSRKGTKLTINQQKYLNESVRRLQANLKRTKRYMKNYTPLEIANLFERRYGVKIAREVGADSQTIQRLLKETAGKKGLLAITNSEFAAPPKIKQTPFGIEFTLSPESFDNVVGNNRQHTSFSAGHEKIILGQARQFITPDGKTVFFSIVPEGASKETIEHEKAHTEEYATRRKHPNPRIENSQRESDLSHLRSELFAHLKTSKRSNVIGELDYRIKDFLEKYHELNQRDIQEISSLPNTLKKMLDAGFSQADLAEVARTQRIEKLNRRLNQILELSKKKKPKKEQNIGRIIIPSQEDIERYS